MAVSQEEKWEPTILRVICLYECDAPVSRDNDEEKPLEMIQYHQRYLLLLQRQQLEAHFNASRARLLRATLRRGRAAHSHRYTSPGYNISFTDFDSGSLHEISSHIWSF